MKEGEELLDALERGEVRVAAPPDWRVDTSVKEAILAIFRASPVVEHPSGFRDKAAFPLRRFDADDGVRLVPGGSAVRRGAHLARGVVCMPPMYVNVGAWVGEGTMVDSHVLVGSCAQVGARVHLSAGVQIGGVLEPPSARPVIVEDEAFVGGNAGLFEGVRVGRRAVIAPGVVLSSSTPVFDLVRERELRGSKDSPLEIPECAVVVPGSRPIRGYWARERGLHLACAVIVKMRDEGTDAATMLEDALR